MTGTNVGTVTLQALYSGDGNNTRSGSAASKPITVKQTRTRLALTCTLVSTDIWNCTTTLKDYYSVSGESIAWSQISGTGKVIFKPTSTCTLSSAGTCTITVVGAIPGKAVIEATYAGDTNNFDSSKSLALKVT
jgi:hypothetical protein